MTDRNHTDTLDAIAVALANRHAEPEAALYLADVALAEARAEVARLKLEIAEEQAATAREAIALHDQTTGDFGDSRDDLHALRARDWKVYNLQQDSVSGVFNCRLTNADDKVELARCAREQIENELPKLAPELFTHH